MSMWVVATLAARKEKCEDQAVLTNRCKNLCRAFAASYVVKPTHFGGVSTLMKMWASRYRNRKMYEICIMLCVHEEYQRPGWGLGPVRRLEKMDSRVYW
jgi:hypothetical protein